MNDLVSIIINCHNGEKYLSKCLKSILDQSYNNWEVIFWDNCSNDNSEKIYKNFNDKRFLYFKSKELTNLSIARNLAVSNTKGKYVCFIDVDDYWETNKLEEQIKVIEKKNAALVFTNFHIKNSLNNKKKIFISSKIDNKNITNFFLKKYPVGISTIMFNKDIIKENLFDEKYHIIGDFDFVMRASLKYKIFGINNSLVTIQLHESNETKKKLKLYVLELLIWYKKYGDKYSGFSNFKKLKSNIYYELCKACLNQKMINRMLKFCKKIDIIHKIKIILFTFQKLPKLYDKIKN